jgi:hypothetical protein
MDTKASTGSEKAADFGTKAPPPGKSQMDANADKVKVGATDKATVDKAMSEPPMDKKVMDSSAEAKGGSGPDIKAKSVAEGPKMDKTEMKPAADMDAKAPAKANPFGDSDLGTKSSAPTKAADFGAKAPPPPPGKPGMESKSDQSKADAMDKAMQDKAMAKQSMDKKVMDSGDDFDTSEAADHDSDFDDAPDVV